MVGTENFAISASGSPNRRSAPELHPVEIGVSDGSCIRISETHNLGHYWLCYTHHESGRAPRFCPECLLVPGQADFYLPRAREMRMVFSELPSQACPPSFSITGERDRTRTESDGYHKPPYHDGVSNRSASRSEMVAEVGFEPTTTFWVVLAYGTRELDRATLLRDK